MATVTGYTAERMKEIEDSAIIDGEVVGDDLILTRFDASTINAGDVRGPIGPQGYEGEASIVKVTSTTRPGAPDEGLVIYETDTKRNYTWNGSLWVPASGEMRGKATKTNIQSIPSATPTNITFSVEEYDTDNIWAVGAPSNFVIPANGGGLWSFILTAKFVSTTGVYLFYIHRAIFGGGSENLVAGAGSMAQGAGVCLVSDAVVVAGDILTCVAYQSAGGSVALDVGNPFSFSAVRLAS